MNINITGLDQLQRQLEEAQRALNSLDGTIDTLKFNPNDPQSVQAAIQQMEAAIDSKIAPYRNNRSCTSTLRINITGSLVDLHRGKKA